LKWIPDKVVDHLVRVAEVPDFGTTKYRIVEELGRGGMAIVYLAEDTELARQVAVKVLNSDIATPGIAPRMRREAEIIARLEHPGIVPVHDVGELPDGSVFYVMKLVRGKRLDQYLGQSVPLNERLRLFRTACEAIAFAHTNGVLHRDLKPQNIMVGAFGEVLILDWGIAKVLRPYDFNFGADDSIPSTQAGRPENDQPETAHGTILGTPDYMAPEQARGDVGQVDERSEVYSLGCILFYLLTDSIPVEARPRSINPRIPKPLESICLKAMAAIPDERYQSAIRLAEDIGSFLAGKPVSAHRDSIIARVFRWISQRRFLVILILTYILMRIGLILLSKR
jgi:eukaryotic-like serine/threonine-protein kinase